MCFGNKQNQNDSTKFRPVPNNFCGGFALDAVLKDLKDDTKANPIETYKFIQEKQDRPEGSASKIFIDATLLHRTAMSLPSSIVLAAMDMFKDIRLTVTVYIKEESLKNELVTGIAEGMTKTIMKGVPEAVVKEKAEEIAEGIIDEELECLRGMKPAVPIVSIVPLVSAKQIAPILSVLPILTNLVSLADLTNLTNLADLANAAVTDSNARHFIVLTNNAHHWVAVKKEGLMYTCYDPAGDKCEEADSLIKAVGIGRMNSLIIAIHAPSK